MKIHRLNLTSPRAVVAGMGNFDHFQEEYNRMWLLFCTGKGFLLSLCHSTKKAKSINADLGGPVIFLIVCLSVLLKNFKGLIGSCQ
ncbi:hypothetical protein TNIN_163851 [Trichonephila inaurata madagascariensis]|uniref:Uncharacterized protein n=1 Tax=Trichonephila inaurata madagascariensis TaxID=2747483 RepID=A0A8X6XVJ2_9ARAC|nr:hypothetical protein TNIN_163851 [Trichonephila inaurata madagascariensis]